MTYPTNKKTSHIWLTSTEHFRIRVILTICGNWAAFAILCTIEKTLFLHRKIGDKLRKNETDVLNGVYRRKHGRWTFFSDKVKSHVCAIRIFTIWRLSDAIFSIRCSIDRANLGSWTKRKRCTRACQGRAGGRRVSIHGRMRGLKAVNSWGKWTRCNRWGATGVPESSQARGWRLRPPRGRGRGRWRRGARRARPAPCEASPLGRHGPDGARRLPCDRIRR